MNRRQKPTAYCLERTILPVMLMAVLLFFVAAPCMAQSFRLPSAPALPLREDSEPDGVQSPDWPVEEESVSRPRNYENVTRQENEKPKKYENGNRIRTGHQSLNARIDTHIDSRNRADGRTSTGDRPDRPKVLLPDEQPFAREERNRRSSRTLTGDRPDRARMLLTDVQPSPREERKQRPWVSPPDYLCASVAARGLLVDVLCTQPKAWAYSVKKPPDSGYSLEQEEAFRMINAEKR